MGEIYRIRSNIRVTIRSRDHRPAHVHIIGPDCEAKISIESMEVIECYGFTRKDMKAFIEYLKPRKAELMEKWNEIHENEK